MHTHHVPTIFALLVPLACQTGDDGDPSPESDEVVVDEDFDVRDLPVIPTKVVAQHEADGSTLFFIERQPLSGEGGDPVIDVAEIGRAGATTVAGALLAHGASPLEVLRHVAPDAAIPATMQADHERVARAQGRDPDDALITFRDDWEVVHDDTICETPQASGWFLFVEHMQSITSAADVEAVILNTSTPVVDRSVTIQAPADSNKNVPVRVCNPETQPGGGCAFDRFNASVFTYGPEGSGTVWSGEVYDCDLLKYWWGARDEDQVYGAQISDAERNVGTWQDCVYGSIVCASLNAYIGVGLHD